MASAVVGCKGNYRVLFLVVYLSSYLNSFLSECFKQRIPTFPVFVSVGGVMIPRLIFLEQLGAFEKEDLYFVLHWFW